MVRGEAKIIKCSFDALLVTFSKSIDSPIQNFIPPLLDLASLMPFNYCFFL